MPNIRISEETNEGLKRLAAKYPHFSAARLGDRLLEEAIAACEKKAHTGKLPIISYIRELQGFTSEDETLSKLDKIAAMLTKGDDSKPAAHKAPTVREAKRGNAS